MAETSVDDPMAADGAAQQAVTLSALDVAGGIGQYLLTHPREIVRTLNNLIAKGDLVTVHFDQGRGMVLTTLLGVNEAQGMLVFDWGASEEANRQLLAAPRHVFVGLDDGVRVQFATGEATRTTWEGRRAFVTPLPRQMLRLQRREFYRVETPRVDPLLFDLPLADAPAELPVHDLSISGVGLVLPDAGEGYTLLQRIADCRVELPDLGGVLATLEVRNLLPLETRRGAQQRIKMGCRFIDIAPAMEARIQRYIIQLERERRRRGSA